MKKLIKSIDSCMNCPYCHYNGDYGRYYDSSYDCEYIGRIVDDGTINLYEKS